MLFNSYIFLLSFLPFTYFIYFIAQSLNIKTLILILLIISSFIFYGYSNLIYLLIFIFSIVTNYLISIHLRNNFESNNFNLFLFLGVTFNLLLLFIFKYFNFFSENFTDIFFNLPKINLILPIGISFYTFQQIGFLLETKKNLNIKYSILEYTLFISFFPQLIAGPILRFSDFIKQIKSKSFNKINYSYISSGAIIFIFGLFKKVIFADFLSRFSDQFYSAISMNYLPSIPTSWLMTTSYTLQIYFDFSAYSEMAIGLGLLFGFKFPINFRSPFQSHSLIDYWNRWNITLTNFFREYLYTPIFLKLSQKTSISFKNHLSAILVSMTMIGLWHGANWNCIFFGFLHGIGLIINHLYKAKHINFFKYIPVIFRRIGLLVFINISFVFFRTQDFYSAIKIIYSMFPIDKIYKYTQWNIFEDSISIDLIRITFVIFLLFIVLFLPSNLSINDYSNLIEDKKGGELISKLKGINNFYLYSFSIILSIIFMFCIFNLKTEQAFIYFQF